MSSVPTESLAGEWVERSGLVNGRVDRWLERVIDASTGHVERVFEWEGSYPDPRLPGPDGRRAIRSAPAAAVTRKSPQPREMEIRDTPSSFTLVLSDHAKARLNQMDLSSAYEVGGGLFGYWQGLTIFIEDVVANPAPGRSEAHRVSIDTDYLKRGETDCYSRRGLNWIGDWHSHPSYGSGNADPSDADFRGWAAMRRESPGLYVGLILHPSRPDSDSVYAVDPWLFPRRSAWVARTSGRRIVVEPLAILAESEADRDRAATRPWCL